MNFKLPTGFTLVETLIAIAIMMIAIAGPMYTASRAILAAEISRDQLIASYLAQEGIEYVRMMRDNAFLAVYPNTSTAWAGFLTGQISLCSSSCEPQLLGLMTVIPSSFIRSIQATVINANDEKIVSSVSWNFHGAQYSVTITDHLTPWQ